MKKQSITFFGGVILSICTIVPAQATEQTDAVNTAELQAAIEAFGVSKEQAKEATTHSNALIEKEKNAHKINQDMLIVSDDFFTLSEL